MAEAGLKKCVHVAVGVIIGGDGRILLAKRPDHLHMGGRWEFPGGKVEDGESIQQAMTRELREELDIGVLAMEKLIEVRHDYGDKQVFLDTWCVTEFSGEARGVEGQALAWVTASDLADYEFPDANQPIVVAVQRWLGKFCTL
ncbi:8-oxo-dGTP diphosphatase MutT [Microbulbifer harenosus]|uniref:8-oxo-dGTP diphosphatase n=1 Tax=Microbulbifer harenosus TaxID=2576840 RepID=A0ABY2UJ30_9GAMM|nr:MULTISPECIES: 8-oxo-dGTP diphosphatase MutT [Microbulbifer]QIL88408.1 8-oxo-dGTP diphosphatase MutT [Microbulbifer sp. SH-1]TLM76931.1 8-oxo-dGTP diphosphatase MutT [Microbulbifer harenosus]